MSTLSVCMIVKDEEQSLERILKQVKLFADEIVIVDTGSKDKTKEIAKKYTTNVYDFIWRDDFALARNFSFKMANSNYIMWLDADDYLSKTAINKLNKFKELPQTADTFFMPYQTAFDKNGKCTFCYLRERIVKNCKFAFWVGSVHEVIVPFGETKVLNINVKHKKIKQSDTKRNLKIYEHLIETGKCLDAREQFYYASELYYLRKYNKAIKEYNKFLKMNNTFFENNIQAHINLAKIFIMQNKLNLALTNLFKTFNLDLPRSEVLCEIGNVYFIQKDFSKAIYYYKLAIKKPNKHSFGFVNYESYNYIPNLQIALCYYHLSNFDLAIKYNKRALKSKRNDTLAQNNQYYYEKQLNNKATDKNT